MGENESALVLFSGGQDSTTSLYWAKNNFKKVYTIGFHYGQRHHYETEVARNLAKIADVEFDLIEISSLSQLSPNALTNSSMAVDREKPDKSLPNTFVPGRNLIFLTYAASYAYSRGIRNLVTGVSQADYSGYPDCRDAFIRSANKTINLATDEEFVIHAPLMKKSKEAIWEMSDEMGIFDLVRYNTLTCYNGIMADGCGRCPACKLRDAGLKKYLKKKEKREKSL